MKHQHLPSALESEGRIRAEAGGRNVAFFLDFDGTLAPIAPRPDMVGFADASREVIAALASDHLVCVVSGRSVLDVGTRVGVPDVYYAGDHGLRIVGPMGSGIDRRIGAEGRAALATAAEDLRNALDSIGGLIVEEKELSLSAHYRLVAPKDLATVKRTVRAVRRKYPTLRATEGRCVVDLRPAVGWGKGDALLWLLSELGRGPVDTYPICIGDDLTDEDLFAATQDWGAPILVGATTRHTLARYLLPDPETVITFLARFAQNMITPDGGRGR